MLGNKQKRNSKATIAIIKSKTTETLYVGLVIDDQPYKVWRLNDFSPAGIDFCNQIMKAYDLGYDLECQLPVIVDGQRQVVPCIYNLNDAPEENNSVKNTIEKILPPPNVEVFDKYNKEDSVIADQCGITEEFLESANKNIEENPDPVAFTEFIPDNDSDSSEVDDVPVEPGDEEFFANEENDVSVEEIIISETAPRDADNNIIEEEDVIEEPFPPMPKTAPTMPPLPEEISVETKKVAEETKPEPIMEKAPTEKPITVEVTPVVPKNNQVEKPAEDSWICSCGSENTSKFCMECGQKKPEPKPEPIVEDNSWVCPSCGSENTSKFCMECGQKKPEPKPEPVEWECPMCHTMNTHKFCGGCGYRQGTPVEKTEAVEQAPVVEESPVIEAPTPVVEPTVDTHSSEPVISVPVQESTMEEPNLEKVEAIPTPEKVVEKSESTRPEVTTEPSVINLTKENAQETKAVEQASDDDDDMMPPTQKVEKVKPAPAPVIEEKLKPEEKEPEKVKENVVEEPPKPIEEPSPKPVEESKEQTDEDKFFSDFLNLYKSKKT